MNIPKKHIHKKYNNFLDKTFECYIWKSKNGNTLYLWPNKNELEVEVNRKIHKTNIARIIQKCNNWSIN